MSTKDEKPDAIEQPQSLADLWRLYQETCLEGAPKFITIFQEQAFYGGALSVLQVLLEALTRKTPDEVVEHLQRLKADVIAFDKGQAAREEELARAVADKVAARPEHPAAKIPNRLLVNITDNLPLN